MVPSWTETLIECGVNIVGRTRFCIHPQEKTKTIEAVGGTKDIDWEKVKSLKPDLIVFDKDENPKSMAEGCNFTFVASHVRSVGDVGQDLLQIRGALRETDPQASLKLTSLAERWLKIAKRRASPAKLQDIPSVLEWLKHPDEKVEKIVYLIWQNPWMSVSKNTFIGSVFEKLGYGWAFSNFDKPYPEIELESLDPAKTLLVFSSEPFPFHKRKASLERIPFAKVIVDGADYSWFGLRSLQFLERELEHR
jgi:ABC-type Fe3+-hydroxamate transport system substrate-binding protein